MIKIITQLKGTPILFNNLDKIEREVNKMGAHYKTKSYMMFYDSTRYTVAVCMLDRTSRSRRGGKRSWSLRCEAYSNVIG